MKITINANDFRNAFHKVRPDNFTFEGLNALFEYLETSEEETGEEIELDPIVLCCEFTEYSSLKSVMSCYDSIKTLEDLEYSTTVIKFGDGRLIIHNF